MHNESQQITNEIFGEIGYLPGVKNIEIIITQSRWHHNGEKVYFNNKLLNSRYLRMGRIEKKVFLRCGAIQ